MLRFLFKESAYKRFCFSTMKRFDYDCNILCEIYKTNVKVWQCYNSNSKILYIDVFFSLYTKISLF